MQNSDDICLKIDEAIHDTRNLLLSITQNQINKTAFKLVRKVTCRRKRRSKTRSTSHRKSLDVMKVELQNVPIPILPESKKIFNESVWQNLPMTTSLARRNFRNPLPQVHKYDSIVVVLDTTKPCTIYKYPIEKPAYQTRRMDIDLSDISLKINLLHSVAVKEPDDSLDLNDRVLATELNMEYNKIMHIETVFNSPNRIIKVVKFEESDTPVCAEDSEMDGVTPEEQKQHLSVILEDIVVKENITPLPNQVNLKLALESSAFIMNETCSNMQIEHDSSSLSSSDFIDSGIDINNSIVLKHLMNFNLGKSNSDECKASFDSFPLCSVLKDMEISTNESILIADSTFGNYLSKDDTNQNVREFLCSNEIEIDQPTSSDSLLISCDCQKISNDQPVEAICDNVTEFSYSNECTSETATQFHLNDQKDSTKPLISTTLNAINNIPKVKDYQLTFAVTSNQFLNGHVEQSISCETTLNNNLTKENIGGPVSCELASNAKPISIPFIKINNHPPSVECTMTKSSNHDNNSGQYISNQPMAISNFPKEDILRRNNDEIAFTKCMSIADITKLSSNKRIPPIDTPNFSDQFMLMPVPTLQIDSPNLPYTSTETDDIIKLSPIDNICEPLLITKPLVTSMSCHSQSTVYSDLPSSLQVEPGAHVSTTTNLSDPQIKTNQNLPLECVVFTSNKGDALPVSSDVNVGLDLIKTEFGNQVAKGDCDYSSSVAELNNITKINTDEVVTLESGILTNVNQGLSSEVPNVSDFSSDLPLVIVKLIDIIKYPSYIEVPKNSDSLAKAKNDLPKSGTEELSIVQKIDTDQSISIESDLLTDSAHSHRVEVSEISSTLTVVSDLPKFDVTNDFPKNSIDSSHFSVPEAINSNNKISMNDSAKCLGIEVSEIPTTLTVVSDLPKFEVNNDFSKDSIDSSNFSVPKATNSHNKTNVCLQDSNLAKVDPFASLDNVDFVKAKQTLSARECEQNCVNIFCAHKKISHNQASQTSQSTMTSSSTLNVGEKRSESGIRGSSEFIIYDCSNDQFKSCNELSRTKNLKLTPSTTPNKLPQSSNATATTVEKTKTGVKRPAEPEKTSQNKRKKTDENHDKVSQKSKHKGGSSNNSRWPLYNFSKPADCFQAVQSYWDGFPLPDPHVDLTSRFHDNRLHFHSNFSITGDDSRTIECLSIYESQIDNVEREIRNIECNLDHFGYTWSRRCINQNLNELERLKSFRTKLLSACEEANRFYTYYRDRRTGWNAFYISEYQKNVIENILHDVLRMYPSYYR